MGFMKKFFLISLMITLPIMLMMGIFQIGKNIEAMNPIDGIWNITETNLTEDIGDCKFINFANNVSYFSIQQSGKFIHLSFDQKSIHLLRGQLSGLQLGLNNQELKLTATIDIDTLPNRMQGEIFFLDCQKTIQIIAIKD